MRGEHNRIIFFASRPCMDIKGLGETIIADLVEKQFIKERLARKCSICIRNLAKRYYRLNAARVEWISGVSAAKSLCATPFPQLC